MVLKRVIIVMGFLFAAQQLFAQRIIKVDRFNFTVSNKTCSFTCTLNEDTNIVQCGSTFRTEFIASTEGWEPVGSMNVIEIKGHFLPHFTSYFSPRCDSLLMPEDECGFTSVLPKDCFSIDTIIYPESMYATLMDTIRRDEVKKFSNDFDKMSVKLNGEDYRENNVKFWIVNGSGGVRQYSGEYLPSYFTDEIMDIPKNSYLILQFKNDFAFCWYFL